MTIGRCSETPILLLLPGLVSVGTGGRSFPLEVPERLKGPPDWLRGVPDWLRGVPCEELSDASGFQTIGGLGQG